MIALEHIRNLGVLKRRGAAISVDVLCDSIGSALDAAEGECESEGLESERRRYDSLDTMAEEERDELDCVILCTPNYMHHDHLMLILRATWWAILAEKPLCTTISDALAIVNEDAARLRRWKAGTGAAAESAQLARHGANFLPIVWVAMEYRYMAPVAELLRRVQNGDAGRIWHATIREHRFPFLPKQQEWNKAAVKTGQTIVEKSCHYLDLLRQFKRGVRPARVAAFAGMDVNFKGSVYNGKECDIWDACMLLIEFEDGSRAFHELCMYAEGTRNQEQIEVVGERAKIEVAVPEAVVRFGPRDGGSDGVVETSVGVDEEALAAGTHFGSVYFELMRFVEGVRGKRSVEVTTEDGAWAVALGVAATLAATERRVVDVDAVLPWGILPSERGQRGRAGSVRSQGGVVMGPPVDYTPAGVAGAALHAGASAAACGAALVMTGSGAGAVPGSGSSSSSPCSASLPSDASHCSDTDGARSLTASYPGERVLLAAAGWSPALLRVDCGIASERRGGCCLHASKCAGMAGSAKL